MSQNIPAPESLSLHIARRPSDGLHALSGWRNGFAGNPSTRLWTWTRENTLREHDISNSWGGYCSSSVSAFYGDHTLVVAGFPKAGGVGPVRVAEYDISGQPFRMVYSFDFGDLDTRSAVILNLDSGAVLLVCYQQVGPAINLKTAYRKNVYTEVTSAALPSNWVNQDFPFDMPDSEIPAMKHTWVQQADGSIWGVMSRDGSQRFALARFSETAAGLFNIDFQDDFLSAYRTGEGGDYRDGLMAPGDELPTVAAVPDSTRGRVLLVYPKAGAQQFACKPGLGFENVTITEVYPDKTKELVTVLPHLVDSHTDFAGMVWPTPKSLEYVVPAFNKDTCTTAWQSGSIKGTTVTNLKPSSYPVGDMSCCLDGHVAFNSNGELQVMKYTDLAKK